MKFFEKYSFWAVFALTAAGLWILSFVVEFILVFAFKVTLSELTLAATAFAGVVVVGFGSGMRAVEINRALENIKNRTEEKGPEQE